VTNHIYIIIFSILVIEIVNYFKTLEKFQFLILNIKKIFHIITSKRISDFWKEKTTLQYSKLLFSSSFKILFILLLVISIFFIFKYINDSFVNNLISFTGIIEAIIIGSIYIYFRKLNNENYNFFQKKLNNIVLSNKIIKKSLFKIEEIIFGNNLKNIENNKHVFITGLPRSGTTILLEFLYKTKKFASLTYNDMPFVLSTNLFSKFNKKKNYPLKERMHRDGIKFNLNSPEAFDDVFFTTFNNDEIQNNFKTYISLILKKYNKELYLSKNNNNYKRINLIKSIFPEAIFIILFRHPLQHANSLLSQHNHFCKLQKKQKFILQYMNHLGHFEFGINHKYWNLPKKFNNEFSLDYWLEQWLLFYKNILDNFSDLSSVVFISYDKMCNNDLNQKLVQRLNLNINMDFKFSLSKNKIIENYNKNLMDECTFVEKKLLSLSL